MKFSPLGTDLLGDPILPPGCGALTERYTVPPFSVLDARTADWQYRKRCWKGQGIEGGSGRPSDLIYDVAEREDWTGKALAKHGAGTSIFDPVLAELAYNWFCPPGGRILDPFCGGSTRGIVASTLGFEYLGYDVRPEQITANYQQLNEQGLNSPQWICSDIRNDKERPHAGADFLFSCPPYGDLEVYSDHPEDISTLSFEDFVPEYFEIIARSCNMLRRDRFAAFVVGDFRDKKTGFYRNFPAITTAAFKRCGLDLYNEAILLSPTGSMAIRAESIFGATRKLVKGHQQLLVFCKGDPRAAADLCK